MRIDPAAIGRITYIGKPTYFDFLVAPAVFGLLTCILTWPMAARPGELCSSRPWYYASVWSYWWVNAYFSGQSDSGSIFVTPELRYPVAASLAKNPLTLANTVPAIPITRVLGPVAAYSIMVLIGFLLAGWFTYLLILRETGDRLAAFIGGAIFSYCPYHYTYIGEMNIFSVQFIPLYFLCARMMSGGKSRLWAGACGVAIALNALACAYYGVLVGFFALVFGGVRLVFSSDRKRVLIQEGVQWLVAFAILLPIFYPIIPAYLESGETGFDETKEGLYQGFGKGEYILMFAPLCGYSVLALAALSIFFRFRQSLFFVALTALLMAIALGGEAWWAPFEWLRHIPIAGAVRTPDRFFAGAMLGLAVLSGLTLASLRALTNRAWKPLRIAGRVLGPLLALMPLVEFYPGPFTMIELPGRCPIPSWTQDDPGAVFVLPFGFENPDAEWMLFQTQHQRPMNAGFILRDRSREFFRDNAIFAQLKPFLKRWREKADVEFLARNGFSYMALRLALLEPGYPRTRSKTIHTPFCFLGRIFLKSRLYRERSDEEMDWDSGYLRGIQKHLGLPIAETEHMLVFRLPDGGASGVASKDF